MKLKNIITATALLFSSAAFAQENEPSTIFSGENNTFGGQISLDLGGTKVNDMMFGEIGISTGIIINHSFETGIFGAGFMSEEVFDYYLNDNYSFTGGYGGLYLRPILFANYPVHLAVPLKFAAGGINYVRDAFEDDDDYWYHDGDRYNSEDSDGYCMFQPGLEVEFNFFKHFHLTAGVSYKMFTDIDLNYYSSGEPIGVKTDLDGLYYGASLRFGIF